MNKTEEAQALQLIELGWNNKMVAEKLGLHHDAVRRLRNKHGIPKSTMKRSWGESTGRVKAKPVYVKKETKPVIAPRGSLSARESMYPAFDGNQKCTTCVYRITVYPNTACGHILATGRQRGCKAGKECTKYLRGNPEDIEWKVL